MKISLRELMLVVVVVAQGAVIFVQKGMIEDARNFDRPATIRVRADSYIHPNGPVSENTNSSDSSSDSNPPGES
jgi:hypothetical protein